MWYGIIRSGLPFQKARNEKKKNWNNRTPDINITAESQLTRPDLYRPKRIPKTITFTRRRRSHFIFTPYHFNLNLRNACVVSVLNLVHLLVRSFVRVESSTKNTRKKGGNDREAATARTRAEHRQPVPHCRCRSFGFSTRLPNYRNDRQTNDNAYSYCGWRMSPRRTRKFDCFGLARQCCVVIHSMQGWTRVIWFRGLIKPNWIHFWRGSRTGTHNFRRTMATKLDTESINKSVGGHVPAPSTHLLNTSNWRLKAEVWATNIWSHGNPTSESFYLLQHAF